MDSTTTTTPSTTSRSDAVVLAEGLGARCEGQMIAPESNTTENDEESRRRVKKLMNAEKLRVDGQVVFT